MDRLEYLGWVLIYDLAMLQPAMDTLAPLGSLLY